MSDPAPDPAQTSEATEHVPWDSIGAPEETSNATQGQAAGSEESQLPLTPWAEQSAAPDLPTVEAEESGAALRSAPAWEEARDDAETMEEPDAVQVDRRRQLTPEPELAQSHGGAWTIPVLCIGIALIACCVLIPQADSNRRLAYERELLQRDSQTIDQQIKVNAEFLKKVADDPELAQRLAERQMKVIPQGVRVLDLTHEPEGMSPFQLVNVAPPPPLPPYKPTGGTIAHLCYGPHSRLYLIGISLGMIAMGLVLGATPPRDA